jgi:hypothetical protein
VNFYSSLQQQQQQQQQRWQRWQHQAFAGTGGFDGSFLLVCDHRNVLLSSCFIPAPKVTVSVVIAQGSDADNIIPDEVILRGTLRALTHEHMMFIKQRIEQVCWQTSTAFRHVSDRHTLPLCAALCPASWCNLYWRC